MTTPHNHRQTVIDRALANNVKITDQMVIDSQTLKLVAMDFVFSYKGMNTFIHDLYLASETRQLSCAQMRGALNVMIAEAKHQRRIAEPQPVGSGLPNDFDEVEDYLDTSHYAEGSNTLQQLSLIHI